MSSLCSRPTSSMAMPLLLAMLAASVPVAHCLYGPGSVVELTPANLKQKVKASGIMLVEFYAPWCGHCKQLVPAYEAAAKALKGIVAVGAVDADAHKELGGEYGVKGFPTIKLLFTDSSGNIKSQDYNGARAAKDLVTFAADKAKSLALKRLGEKPSSGGAGATSGGGKPNAKPSGGNSDSFYSGTSVEVLGDDNWSSKIEGSAVPYLVEFYAPWCGHCKNLKPVYIQAAKELQAQGSGVKLGAVDCTTNEATCSQFGIQGYPTLKYFGPNARSSPEDYNGGRDTASILAFAGSKAADAAAASPPREVEEITSSASFAEGCGGDAGAGIKPQQLCFLAFLPDILDSGAAGRNAYIDILKAMTEAYKGRPFSFLWSQGGAQPSLEANVGVGGFGYPALVALNPKERKYSVLRGSFESKHVKEFIESLRKGGQAVLPVQGAAPWDVKTIAAWDGKDGQLVEEDEFSLEDLMGDDDSAGSDKTEL